MKLTVRALTVSDSCSYITRGASGTEAGITYRVSLDRLYGPGRSDSLAVPTGVRELGRAVLSAGQHPHAAAFLQDSYGLAKGCKPAEAFGSRTMTFRDPVLELAYY